MDDRNTALIVEMYLAGAMPKAISEELGLHHDQVVDVIRGKKLMRNPGAGIQRWSKEEDDKIERFLRSDPTMSAVAIASHFGGRTVDAVRNRVCTARAKLGIPPPQNHAAPPAAKDSGPAGPVAEKRDVYHDRRGVSLPRLKSLDQIERVLTKDSCDG